MCYFHDQTKLISDPRGRKTDPNFRAEFPKRGNVLFIFTQFFQTYCTVGVTWPVMCLK